MKIEVGEYYLSANNEIIKIEFPYNKNLFEDTSGRVYSIDGVFIETKYEDFGYLIAHIPKQLLNHLVVEVNNYHTDNEFKQKIDNVYGETK
jgi:hypothetical protein